MRDFRTYGALLTYPQSSFLAPPLSSQDEKNREDDDREKKEKASQDRQKARGEVGRVEDVLEKMGGGHRALSMKSVGALANSPAVANNRTLSPPPKNNGEEDGGKEEGAESESDAGADKRPSIAVLYEVEGNLGRRVRADTGQTEDVITIKQPIGRSASIIEEGGEDSSEDDNF